MALVCVAEGEVYSAPHVIQKLKTNLARDTEGLIGIFKASADDLKQEMNNPEADLILFIERQEERFEAFREGFKNSKGAIVNIIKNAKTSSKAVIHVWDIQEHLIIYFQDSDNRDALNAEIAKTNNRIQITDSEIRIFITYNENFKSEIETILQEEVKKPEKNMTLSPIIYLGVPVLIIIICLIIYLLSGEKSEVQNSETQKSKISYIKLFLKKNYLTVLLGGLAIMGTAAVGIKYNKKNNIHNSEGRSVIAGLLTSFGTQNRL